MKKLTGVAASPGIAIGKALVYSQKVTISRKKINKDEIDAEIRRFEEALKRSIDEEQFIEDKVKRELGEKDAEIFQAHILMLQDPSFVNSVKEKIRNELLSPEQAVVETVNELVEKFNRINNEYLRQRAIDVQDIGSRVLRNLLGLGNLVKMQEGTVVVAETLNPSDVASMDIEKVVGLVIEETGKTSHVVILSKQYRIPAVINIPNVTEHVTTGQTVIVDGNEGIVIVDPDQNTLSEYRAKEDSYRKEVEELNKYINVEAVTLDGRKIVVSANVGNLSDVDLALKFGADGIGLLRTEFLYLDRESPPSEEEQFKFYKEVVQKMGNRPVIIRTLDIGGDKKPRYIDIPNEMNPFLGWRGLRLELDYEDLFRDQIRAILMASAYGNVKVMFPMVTDVNEVIRAKKIISEVEEELDKKNIKYGKVDIGIMVEVPSAALMADVLADEVDFFSIGTNDLTQYTLAVDRTNQKVSKLYNDAHPAVMRLIKMTIDYAHKKGKWVGICGELAGNSKVTDILVGLGVDELSMIPSYIPEVKKRIVSIKYSESIKKAEKYMLL
ncbi:phosphoenolpyruvate--protein phosphotransferase [Acidilobus sp.]|uniref:phosphoenolpyruvate--protein phosphotransferase n=1 Tax=Acidilobus sp. TaxID=1872109 RepID=UPI003D080775